MYILYKNNSFCISDALSDAAVCELLAPVCIENGNETVVPLYETNGNVAIYKNEENEVKLAVENLPRTCLTRTSDEMISLVKDTGAGMIFDTNHNLIEDNCDYINNVADAGIEILSVHFSDYYRDEDGVLDERHTLPGTGINKWNDIVDTLIARGYEGPLMYEVPANAKNRAPEDPITADELAQNMRDVRDGKIR